MANGRMLVNPPVFTPLPFGLLSAATEVASSDQVAPSGGARQRWEAGITWQSHCPGGDGTYDPCVAFNASGEDVDDPPLKEATTEFLLRGATPFAIYARFDCNPIGFWEQASTLATEALTRVESHEVERIFDTGIAPRALGVTQATAYPHLRATEENVDDSGATLQTIPDILTTSPVDIVEGLGRLEEALSDCYHGQGVIHVPSILAADLAAHTLVTARGSQLTTLLGNRVSLGSGYSGASPSGVQEPDVAWVYATGTVFYYRSGIIVHDPVDSFDRSRNTAEALAERRYIIGWDCCHIAIPIHIGGVAAGEFDSAGEFIGGS